MHFTFHHGPAHAIGSPTHPCQILSAHRYIRVWDVQPKANQDTAKLASSGKKKEPSLWSLSGHTDAVMSVDWSPMGDKIGGWGRGRGRGMGMGMGGV
jgi:WD40 repeat protein